MIPILPDFETDRDLQRLALKARVAATLPDALLINDPEGRVWWINPAFERMMRYGTVELEGRHAWKVLRVRSDEQDLQRRAESERAGRDYRMEISVCRKDGSTVRVEVELCDRQGGF